MTTTACAQCAARTLDLPEWETQPIGATCPYLAHEFPRLDRAEAAPPPPWYTDEHAVAHGYRDRAEACQDAAANGWWPEMEATS